MIRADEYLQFERGDMCIRGTHLFIQGIFVVAF